MAKQLSNTQKKIRILEKIQSLNKTGEEFAAMKPAQMLEAFPDISTEEFRMLCELQESVISNTLFTYLCTE